MSLQQQFSEGAGGVNPSALPLLYKSPMAVDAVRHKHASISPSSNFSFAKHINSLPINAIEFIEVAKFLPIVFTSDKNPLPVAIVGLEQENYLVQADNSWVEGVYIPAYLRQYPFIFFENVSEKKFYLCIDEKSENYNETQIDGANPLFNADGKPSDLSNNALKFCTAFYQHHLATRELCNALEEHKLLQPYSSEIKLASGKKTTLSGFQMIDEKALNKLPDKVYLSFRHKGYLPFIYFALASTSNWNRLVALQAKL